MSKPQFSIAVTAIIENERNEILLIKRNPNSEYPNYWEDVGGRLKQSEIPEDGLRREIKEETGLSEIKIVKPLTIFHTFRNGIRKAENELIGIAYWCKTKATEVKISDEHTEFKWLPVEEAIKLTEHPALKKYIQIYLQEKGELK